MSSTFRRTFPAVASGIIKSFLMIFALAAPCAKGHTTTSLYIPGFEPQPVSADILGVGSDGRTTWVLHQGKATHASDLSRVFGTATLVEGPSDASLTYANPDASFTIGQACSFSEGFAICTLVGGDGSTAVQTELTSHVPVQVACSASQITNTSTTSSIVIGSEGTVTTVSVTPTILTTSLKATSQTPQPSPSPSSSSSFKAVPGVGVALLSILLALS